MRINKTYHEAQCYVKRKIQNKPWIWVANKDMKGETQKSRANANMGIWFVQRIECPNKNKKKPVKQTGPDSIKLNIIVLDFKISIRSIILLKWKICNRCNFWTFGFGVEESDQWMRPGLHCLLSNQNRWGLRRHPSLSSQSLESTLHLFLLASPRCRFHLLRSHQGSLSHL